jgi:hypothetical protein
MRVGVPRERKDGERRVGLLPEGVAALVASNHGVLLARGASERVDADDLAYANAGAHVANDAAEVFGCALIRGQGTPAQLVVITRFLMRLSPRALVASLTKRFAAIDRRRNARRFGDGQGSFALRRVVSALAVTAELQYKISLPRQRDAWCRYLDLPDGPAVARRRSSSA